MNDEFEGQVRGLSSEGLGVVEHPEGRVFFAPGVWPGDRARFKVERLEKRYGFARLIELLEASADRVAPPCPHQGYRAGACGGCPWMIGSYESQLRFKEHRVRHAVERADLGAGSVRPIWASAPLGYRNRAQFKTDGEVIGFVSEGSHAIAPIEDCLVLTPSMRERLREARGKLPREDWRPAPGYPWNFVDVDEGLAAGEDPVLNRRRAFQQGNGAQNERMRGWIRTKLAESDRAAGVVELFAGSGNFTGVISELGFARILAYEVSRESIDELNARKLPGVTGVATDLFHPAAWRIVAREAKGATQLVLDPPRSGAKGVEQIAAMIPTLERVLYVSCDVATFTRDAAALAKNGFALRELQPLDLFPQTPHVEVLAEFLRL